jgi:8-oxo-dGTP diphosphatase
MAESTPSAAGRPDAAEAVEVGVAIVRAGGRVLICRRPEGVHLGGLWEFPGGKLEAGESPPEAAARELEEELGLEALELAPFHRQSHRYPERRVELHFFLVRGFRGEPRGREGQEWRWATPGELEALPTPDANREVIALLEGLDA